MLPAPDNGPARLSSSAVSGSVLAAIHLHLHVLEEVVDRHRSMTGTEHDASLSEKTEERRYFTILYLQYHK